MPHIKPCCIFGGAEHPGDLARFFLCLASSRGHYNFFSTVGLYREEGGKDQP